MDNEFQSPSASKKMMDYLARRQHTEKELREKLQTRYTSQEIDDAIEYGKTKGWIAPNPEAESQLAEETAETLKRRGKGIEYINQFLEKKGLPSIKANSSEELEKARQLVENKFGPREKNMDVKPSREEVKKLNAKKARFLISRGFDMETVEKIVDGDSDEA